MKLTLNDALEVMPTLLAREPNDMKRQQMLKTAEWFEEVKNRTLLCDFHGIKVFEYQGKQSLELSDEVASRMQNLERQTSDSVREMVEDLTALSMTASLHVELISPPPQPLYDEGGLVNGESYHKAAAAIWTQTSMHRGLWELIRRRLGAKLNQLRSSSGKARLEQAAELKKEITAAIDVLADAGSRKAHGAATLLEWTMPDGTSRCVTLPWAALQMTCTLIFLNLSPPSKGEVRKCIEAKYPKLKITDAAWGKVWTTAGLKWLRRKGNW